MRNVSQIQNCLQTSFSLLWSMNYAVCITAGTMCARYQIK